MNLRPPRPERGALPGCATLRLEGRSYSGALIPSQAQAVFRYRALPEPRLRPAQGETDGARNTATGEIRSRASLRGPAGAGGPARQGRHRRHHRGHRLRRPSAVEPDRRRLRQAARRGRQEPRFRARRRAPAGADGGLRQRRAGACLRDGQPDLAEHRRASGRHHVHAGARGGAGARHRRARADRRGGRRLRGDDPHRARDQAQQRGPRLPRARHHRTVRRRGRGRAPVEVRQRDDDQRARRRRLAVLRACWSSRAPAPARW